MPFAFSDRVRQGKRYLLLDEQRKRLMSSVDPLEILRQARAAETLGRRPSILSVKAGEAVQRRPRDFAAVLQKSDLIPF